MNNRIDIAYEFAKAIDSEDISKIILYGSVARGDDGAESDIDILIVSNKADELMDSINAVAVDFILEREELISPHLMTEEHFNKTLNNPFLANVLKEGIFLNESRNS